MQRNQQLALIRSKEEKLLTELTRIKIIVIRWFHEGDLRQPIIIECYTMG